MAVIFIFAFTVLFGRFGRPLDVRRAVCCPGTEPITWFSSIGHAL